MKDDGRDRYLLTKKRRRESCCKRIGYDVSVYDKDEKERERKEECGGGGRGW